MRQLFTVVLLLLFLSVKAQLSRFPYIQSTTQTSTIIAWKTNNDVVGKVVYGTNPSALLDTISESTATKRHALTLKGLQKDTKYYYQVFSGNNIEASEFFQTASDSTDQEFSFIQYGDCGYNSGVQSTLGSLMEADSASFAVICGDIDQGGIPHISNSDGGDDYDEIFFDVYNNGTSHKMLSHECHFPSIGNHDVYANNGATYELEFYLPHNNPDSTERYYSFTWGDAKFIALDVITPFDPTSFPINQLPTNQRWWTDFRPGSAQYDFLVNELQCNDKKWVFVYFHEGPWTNYWGPDYYIPNAVGGDYFQYEGNTMVRQHLVPLFEQYGVDFVLVGHSHLYEQAEKNGVWYITSGGAGDVSGNTQYANHPEILKAIIANHYIRFTVDNDTVSYEVIDQNNAVIDTFNHSKNYTPYLVTPTISPVSCNGGGDGQVSLAIQGPKGPYTVEWYDGSTGLVKNNLPAGTYYAFIKNTYGCEKVFEFVIPEPTQQAVSILSSTGTFEFCEGESIQLFADTICAAYNWNTPNSSDTITVNQAGIYNLNVLDFNGCVRTSPSVQINQVNNPIATFGYANFDSAFNFLCPDSNIDQYIWDFGDGQNNSTTSNAVEHIFEENGTYLISLLAINECDSSTFTLSIEVDSYEQNPTSIQETFVRDALVISPNPFNNYTQIRVDGLGKELKVQLFDLTGRIVWHQEESTTDFKILKGSLNSGTYYLKVSNAHGQYTFGKIMIN